MATTTEIPGIHSVPPPVNGAEPAAEVKRPRGRPQKCRQCGENIDPTRQHVCTPPPGTVEETSGDRRFLADALELHSGRVESHHGLPLPGHAADRPQGQREAVNLGCYSTAFTRDDIMNEHGSGVYRIDVTQLEAASSRSRRIAREVFTIINPKYPPIVPPGDWVDDKVNDMWKWGAPPGMQSNAGIAAGYPPGFNMEKVLERTEQGLKMGIELAKQMTPPPAPVKDDTLLLTLLTELIKNRPEPQKPDDTATKALLGFLEKQNDRLAAELQELRKNAAAPVPQKGILEQMKELKPVIAEAVELFTAKNGGEQPWWAAPLQTIMEGVGEAIPSVVDMMKNNQGQQRQQQPNPWQQNQGLPAPQAQPQQQPQAAAAPSHRRSAHPS